MTKALIIIGDLRFKDSAHFEDFKSFFADYDIFISTYKGQEKMCAELTSAYLLHSRDIEKDMDVCVEEGAVSVKGGVLQWFHLDQILKTYESQLLKYDVVVKTRSDLALADLSKKSWEESLQKVDKDTMYMRSDFLFYARSDHFIKTLKDFYHKIKTYYWGKTIQYIPLNYDNILNSGDDCTPHNVRFTWLVLPNVLIERRKDNEGNRIWQGDFLALKQLIKEHYDFLADFNSLEHPASLPLGCFRNYLPKREFASEQVFCIESINAGLVKPPPIAPPSFSRGGLLTPMEDRHGFKFSL